MITDPEYNEDKLKKLIRDGITGPEALRDFNIIKGTLEGKSKAQLAVMHNLSARQVQRIRVKYGARK